MQINTPAAPVGLPRPGAFDGGYGGDISESYSGNIESRSYDEPTYSERVSSEPAYSEPAPVVVDSFTANSIIGPDYAGYVRSDGTYSISRNDWPIISGTGGKEAALAAMTALANADSQRSLLDKLTGTYPPVPAT